MSQSSGAVSAIQYASAATTKQRKRKAPVNAPFLWGNFPGMELCFAKFVRANADRLRAYTSDTTPIYVDIGKRLEARFKTNAFQGVEGIKLLRQKYKHLRDCAYAHVYPRSRSGNARYALPSRICTT